MKKNIHPKYMPTKVTCACGNAFVTRATVPEIRVETCSVCHPFYTGQMKFLDKAGRVDAFRAKQKSASKKVLSKTEKRKQKRAQKVLEEFKRPESLAELRQEK